MAGRVDDALRATRAVCRALGLPDGDLDVIRTSSYVAIRVGGTPYVARVGAADAAAPHAREMAIARALAAAGVPVAEPAPLDEPIVVDGHSAVGMWLWVDEVPHAEPTTAQLGAVLRLLHDCAGRLDLVALGLPAFRPPGLAGDRLRRLVDGGHVDEATARALTAAVDAPGPFDRGRHGLVHGDFRRANVLISAAGPVVIDFDTASRGPQEWDLTLIAQQHRHFGLPAADYDGFLLAYGGVVDSRQFDALCHLRDVTSAIWALTIATGEPAFRAEAQRRVASALDPSDRSPWSWDGLPPARSQTRVGATPDRPAWPRNRSRSP